MSIVDIARGGIRLVCSHVGLSSIKAVGATTVCNVYVQQQHWPAVGALREVSQVSHDTAVKNTPHKLPVNCPQNGVRSSDRCSGNALQRNEGPTTSHVTVWPSSTSVDGGQKREILTCQHVKCQVVACFGGRGRRLILARWSS